MRPLDCHTFTNVNLVKQVNNNANANANANANSRRHFLTATS